MSSEHEKLKQLASDLRNIVSDAYTKAATLDDDLRRTPYIPCDSAASAERWLRGAWEMAPPLTEELTLRNKIIDAVIAEAFRQRESETLSLARSSVTMLVMDLRNLLFKEQQAKLHELEKFKRSVLKAAGVADPS